jgi:hypothetical protein
MADLAAKQGKRASIAVVGDVAIIQSQSGRGLVWDDPESFFELIDIKSSDEVLGLAANSALERSRFLDASSARELGERAAAERKDRLSELASKLNLRGQQSLLKGMALCHVVSNDESFYVQPTKHVKLDAWEGIPSENVLVPPSAIAEELGRSIRDALGRCR